jgi:hypothetical protein
VRTCEHCNDAALTLFAGFQCFRNPEEGDGFQHSYATAEYQRKPNKSPISNQVLIQRRHKARMGEIGNKRVKRDKRDEF